MDILDPEKASNSLRDELKRWEKTFAAQHDGRKAGRDDIKADAIISLKYRQYNKLREALSEKPAPQTPSKRTTGRNPTRDADATPKARQEKLQVTPMKRKLDSGADSANIEVYLSPEGPKVIGPTPQRDGIVLGIFDVLPEDTPSRRRAVLGETGTNVAQTPSRNHRGDDSDDISNETRARGEKTPQSVGKRFMLDKFVTPSKRRRLEPGTPSSLKGLSTPAFLRRGAPLDAIDEDDEPTPRRAPWKRIGLARGLSVMIQSLKKQEDDRLDEEADIMRELEMEAEGIIAPKKSRALDVIVEDSQAAMPLGPDGGESSDDELDENDLRSGLDRDGNPRKIWKKRGQKRTTRRVIMRPSFVKPLALVAQEDDDASETEKAVAETQVPQHNEHDDGEHSEHDFSDDDESDYASDASHTPAKPKAPRAAAKESASADTTIAGTVKTAARKIKATAHANYRRLKIKGKGGTGKGRFGRK